MDRNVRLAGLTFFFLIVALRKESVDRNVFIWSFVARLIRRSPQGERG